MTLDEAVEAIGKGVDVAGIGIIVVGAATASALFWLALVAPGRQRHTLCTAGA
jgi:hypothetical protein